MVRCAQRGSLLFILCLFAPACGGETGDGKESGQRGSDGGGKAPGEGIDYTFESLDVTRLDEQSENWCTPPAFEPAGFSALDRATLADVLADYTSGWMAPLHESLLGLNEVDLWDSVFESVLASYHLDCDWNEDEDLEWLPPPDGELIDPEQQRIARDDVRQTILDAEVLSEGEVVRLVLRECEDCVEGLAQHPIFLDARITTDGVLVFEVELGEGQTWVRTAYVTPNAAVVVAPLAQGTVWLADVASATPDSDDVTPDIFGTMTGVIRKDNSGGTSATFGISSLSFDARPGQVETVWGQALDECVGFHLGISGATQEAQAAMELGNFELTIPGAVNCDVAECGDQERTQNWVYSLGGVSLTAHQPGPSDPENVHLDVTAQHASTARVGQNEFAKGGVGKLGQGGHVGLSVDKTPGGFLVTFEPELNLGGAMTISSFSDHLRMHLPDWLQDEIFDVTFGGEPRAQIFVPAREPCDSQPMTGQPPTEAPSTPARRSVQITEGTFRGTRSTGELVAETGSCVGKTLVSESSLQSTSDWVDVGYACQ